MDLLDRLAGKLEHIVAELNMWADGYTAYCFQVVFWSFPHNATLVFPHSNCYMTSFEKVLAKILPNFFDNHIFSWPIIFKLYTFS